MAKPSTSDAGWRSQLILRSQIGRRFVLLFILCALLPVALFGVLADRAVHAALREQALARVQRSGKDASTSVLQQFAVLDDKLRGVARGAVEPDALVQHEPRVRNVTSQSLAILTGDQQRRVQAEKALLRVQLGVRSPVLELVRWAPTVTDSLRIVVAEVDIRRVIGGVSGLDLVPPASKLCMTIAAVSLGCVKAIDADADDETPLERTSSVFLRYEFGAPALMLTVAESDEAAFATLYTFRQLFVPIAIAAVCLAALFAQITIRRQTAPLTALDVGTKRVAAGDFAHTVEVQGTDELGQLAAAFNGMTKQLNRQFHSLELHHDVDVAVLAATSRAEVINVLMSRIGDVVACDRALMLVSPPDGRASARAGWRVKGARENGAALPVTLSDTEHAELTTAPADGFTVSGGGARSYLRALPSLRAAVYPVRVGGSTEGALILGFESDIRLSDDDHRRVRHLIAQVAVAFSNLRLMEELRALNSGTLEALARTTDAASPWTAGHSVRVTAIAVALARADGLDEQVVDLVRRGALLHDIGKIAVPVGILDKPGALTAEERAVMNTHPLVGVRILQPIAAFEPLLPMVRNHHERWDGTGYPDRQRGEQIHPLARLLAVADVAESMLAARPYRAALPLEYVVDFVRNNAGRHFDPRIAQVFADGIAAWDAGLLAALAPASGEPLAAPLREVA